MGVALMIKINLLPEEARKEDLQVWKLYRLLAYCFFVVSILLWGYNLAMFKYVEHQISNVDKEIAAVHVWQERFEEAKNIDSEVAKRNNIVLKLGKNQLAWNGFLFELGNITPPGCWLTSIKQGAKSEELTISGRSFSMESLLKFITTLENRSDISSVRLVKTSVTSEKDIDVTDFTLEVFRSGATK